MYTLSVDIGGTFTDVVAFDEGSGRISVGKSLTTPSDLHQGVLAALENAAGDLGLQLRSMLGEARRFVHATTQSSNAIFAFAGAKTAVITTRGFGDTLTIMRATGRVAGLSVFERQHYRMTAKPRLLANEQDIFEVSERMDYAGRPVVPLDEDAIRALAATLKERGYEAVAVAFLFSHKNDAHERRVREILRSSVPRIYVSLSSEVAPVLGEYERSATALFNAYVGPVIEGYLDELVSTLGRAGLKCAPLIVQANGGLTTPAQTIPIFTVESGPAAGVVGSAHLARQIFVPISLATKPPRENQTIRAALGDVIYFQEWEGSYQRTGFEAIGLFYGNEIVREWRGDAPVNVIGRIDPAQHALIQEIGDRVWRKGGEKITIRIQD